MIKLFYRKIEEIKVYKHILNKIAIFYLILHLHLILQFYIVQKWNSGRALSTMKVYCSLGS